MFEKSSVGVFSFYLKKLKHLISKGLQKYHEKKERKKLNFILGFRFFVRKILKIGRRQ